MESARRARSQRQRARGSEEGSKTARMLARRSGAMRGRTTAKYHSFSRRARVEGCMEETQRWRSTWKERSMCRGEREEHCCSSHGVAPAMYARSMTLA
jgi:hypothetical protein